MKLSQFIKSAMLNYMRQNKIDPKTPMNFATTPSNILAIKHWIERG